MPVVNWLSWLLSEGETEGNKSPRLEILVEERIPFHVIKSQRKSFVWLEKEGKRTRSWSNCILVSWRLWANMLLFQRKNNKPKQKENLVRMHTWKLRLDFAIEHNSISFEVNSSGTPAVHWHNFSFWLQLGKEMTNVKCNKVIFHLYRFKRRPSRKKTFVRYRFW